VVGVALFVALLQSSSDALAGLHGFTLSDAAPLVKFAKNCVS
jgi:hypothetical protein